MMNVIERIFPKLGQYTDIPTLLPFLKPRNLLTDEEYLQLSKKWEDGYRDTTVHQLVVALKRKCPRWERELIAALEESVHPENGSMTRRPPASVRGLKIAADGKRLCSEMSPQ